MSALTAGFGGNSLLVEAVIFCGIPGSGKTTFYRQNLASTHARISLDELRTREREEAAERRCAAKGRPFVVDDTNPTASDRTRHLRIAQEAGFRVVGYFFDVAPGRQSAVRKAGRRGSGSRFPRSSAATSVWSLPGRKRASTSSFASRPNAGASPSGRSSRGGTCASPVEPPSGLLPDDLRQAIVTWLREGNLHAATVRTNDRSYSLTSK